MIFQILAQKMYENDASKIKSWDPDMSRIQSAVSGGETSSDEGEALSQNCHQNLLPESESLNMYQYNSDEASLNNQQSPTREDRTRTNSLAENSEASGPVRCQICAINLQSLSDLQMHNFVKHAANRNIDKENTQTDKRCENT